MIRKPVNVVVNRLPRRQAHREESNAISSHCFHLRRRRSAEGRTPLMDFRVAIRKRKTTGEVVIGCRNINKLSFRFGWEKSRVIDAVWMFIDENPRLGRPRNLHRRHLDALLVNGGDWAL